MQEKEFKTKRYGRQIRKRLETYVQPIIGDLPIAGIALAEIKQVLVPIWTGMRPTANRIRKHLEDTINWAIAEGVRKRTKATRLKSSGWNSLLSFKNATSNTIPHCRTTRLQTSSQTCAARTASRPRRWSS